MFNLADINKIQDGADACKLLICKTSLLINASTIEVSKKLFIIEDAVLMLLGLSMWDLV